MEWRPSSARAVYLDSPIKAWVQRIKSPGAVTPGAIHVATAATLGGPIYGVEIVDVLTPSILQNAPLYPGTDTGAVESNTYWTNQSNVANSATFANVNKNNNDATYNFWYLTPQPPNATQQLLYRGTTAPPSGRITSVSLYVRWAVVQNPGGSAPPNNDVYSAVGNLRLGGTDYYGLSSVTLTAGSVSTPFQTNLMQTWYLNPKTVLPWTSSDLSALCNGTDMFGALFTRLSNPGSGSVAVSGIWLVINYCTENRFGSFYGQTTPANWTKFTLSNTAALTANKFYYLVCSVLNGAAGISLQTLALSSSTAPLATLATDTGKETRQFYEATCTQGGCVTATTSNNPGEMIAMLLEAPGGTTVSQSQPYTAIGMQLDQSNAPIIPTSDTGSWAGAGQTLTPPSGTYVGLRVTAAWRGASMPDQPLKIEVRSGAGMLTGGGTLAATATLQPTQASGAYADYTIMFDNGATVVANGTTQYALYFRSTASQGKNWAVPVMVDVDGASAATLNGTTQAQLDAATSGGTTDSYFDGGGSTDTKKDVPVALVQATTAPASITVTAKAAGTFEGP